MPRSFYEETTYILQQPKHICVQTRLPSECGHCSARRDSLMHCRPTLRFRIPEATTYPSWCLVPTSSCKCPQVAPLAAGMQIEPPVHRPTARQAGRQRGRQASTPLHACTSAPRHTTHVFAHCTTRRLCPSSAWFGTCVERKQQDTRVKQTPLLRQILNCISVVSRQPVHVHHIHLIPGPLRTAVILVHRRLGTNLWSIGFRPIGEVPAPKEP